MHEGRVAVPVRVRLARRDVRAVVVLVVLVMAMSVLVLHRGMRVLVLMPLGQVQPQPHPHQASRDHQVGRERLAEHEHRQHGADERRQREVVAGARGAEMA